MRISGSLMYSASLLPKSSNFPRSSSLRPAFQGQLTFGKWQRRGHGSDSFAGVPTAVVRAGSKCGARCQDRHWDGRRELVSRVHSGEAPSVGLGWPSWIQHAVSCNRDRLGDSWPFVTVSCYQSFNCLVLFFGSPCGWKIRTCSSSFCASSNCLASWGVI